MLFTLLPQTRADPGETLHLWSARAQDQWISTAGGANPPAASHLPRFWTHPRGLGYLVGTRAQEQMFSIVFFTQCHIYYMEEPWSGYFSGSSMNTSSTAQGGGGSFKNRRPIGEVGCCESRMVERIHWWTERWLRSPLFLSLSFFLWLSTYLPTETFYVSI